MRFGVVSYIVFKKPGLYKSEVILHFLDAYQVTTQPFKAIAPKEGTFMEKVYFIITTLISTYFYKND